MCFFDSYLLVCDIYHLCSIIHHYICHPLFCSTFDIRCRISYVSFRSPTRRPNSGDPVAIGFLSRMTVESVTSVGSKPRVGWEQGQGVSGTGEVCVGNAQRVSRERSPHIGNAPRVSRERSPRVEHGRGSSRERFPPRTRFWSDGPTLYTSLKFSCEDSDLGIQSSFEFPRG